MGGEILLTLRENIPDNYRLVIAFTDKTCLVIHYWWFGYAYYAPLNRLDSIPMIARVGPNVTDLSRKVFSSLLRSQNPKTRVKAFLLDQSKVAGIGNAYIHNILFLAGLHPLRTISSVSEEEINHLYLAILAGLKPSLEKGGAFYEVNLYGEKGGFKVEDILIGYKAGSPCPRCGTLIEKIRTGNTSSFICPGYQSLDESIFLQISVYSASFRQYMLYNVCFALHEDIYGS